LKKSVTRFAAVLVAGVLIGSVSGCAGAAKPYLVPGSSLSIGESGILSNLNSAVGGAGASMRASADIAALTMPAFYTPDASGALVANTDFGTVKTGPNNTVTFTLTGKASWSDGEKVSIADLALSYLEATRSPALQALVSGTAASTNSKVPVTDPTAGPAYFGRALAGTSLGYATSAVASANSLTVTFAHPVEDFKTVLPITQAAHLVGKLALASPAATAADGEALVLAALKDPSESAGNWPKVAAVYGSSFAPDPTSGAFDAKTFVTAGPYLITKANSRKVLLKANPAFSWGPKATIQNVALNCYNNTDELLSALTAGSVDLASPGSTSAQTLSAELTSLKGKGLQVTSGGSTDQEVIVLNQSQAAAFDSAAYGNDTKKSLAVAQAFFAFMPRSGIWNDLLGSTGLTKSDSLALQPGSPNYASATQQNGTKNYQFQNAELSQQIWKKAGFSRTVKVRVLFDSANPRGQLEYTRLAAWSVLGGLTIENVSNQDPTQVLASGGWDAYITTIPALQSSESAMGGLLALSGIKDSSIDALLQKLAKSKNPAQESATLVALDQALIGKYVALPIFELPKIVVNSKRMVGYKANLANESVTTGYSNWVVKATSK
jgi:ABC-type oligopeptide transport system substrate-binding subunit